MSLTQPTAVSHPGRGVGRRLPVAVAAIGLMGLLVLGAGAPAEASEPAPKPADAAFEQSFMREMIMHHHMAVMMSQVCIERTDIRPALQEMCQSIVDDQEAEIMSMQAWLLDWYDVSYDPMADMTAEEMAEMMKMAMEMRAMSPADFERAFLKEMIGHHRAAIAPAKDCEKNASHGELRRLCRGIVKSQTMEIRVMHRWLCNWYGKCPAGVVPEPQPAIAA